jgi:hypothetical protein
MKACKFLILTLAAALPFGLAACGGGGGGGNDGGNPNPAFTTTATLAQAAGATFNVGLALNDTTVVVGTMDGGATPTTLKAVAWTVTPGIAPAPPTSNFTPLALPALHGPYGAAYGINNAGAIVGETVVTASGLIVPAYWTNNTATAALLPLGLTATQGTAYGLNTAGRIAGEVIEVGVTKAVTWDTSAALAPTLLSTSTLAPPTTASSAYFINDNGEIVGELSDAAGTHAAVWRALAGVYGDPILLSAPGTLAGNSIALSINTAGNIVGEVEDSTSGLVHAVRWMKGTGTAFTAVDLGPTGSNSGAAGINAAGRTVGYVGANASAWGPTVTPVTMNAALTDSHGLAINSGGQTVGLSGGQAFVALP